MPRPRERVVVSGSLAQRPGRGGHAWVFLQYLLGFKRLGWDVLFLDRLEPGMCRDEHGQPCPVEHSVNLRYLHGIMDRFGLGDAWALSCNGGTVCLGLSRQELREQIRRSTFLLNIMGFCQDEELLALAPVRAFLDIDPGFAQMWRALGQADVFRGHDVYFTVGENLGRPDCGIPTCGLRWIPTPQPVAMEWWSTDPGHSFRPDGPFTSVAAWRGVWAPVEYQGRRYGLRAHAFRRFASLPRLAGDRFVYALDIAPDDAGDRALLEQNGWLLVDPAAVAGGPGEYRDFIARSAAEFAVPKSMYVETRSGWLSDRSLCYLASGKPVVVQDTGLRSRYATGEGLLLFTTLDEALAAVHEVRANYRRHATAARELAWQHFHSDRVLGRLAEQATAA